MLGCAQVRNAQAKGAAARSGNWRRRCAALADDRDRLATRLNALEREMHDMSAGIKQQIEAAKADATKTAKQAPRWPESTPPVPMTLVNVAVMVDRLSPPTASRFEPGSATATNRAEQAPPEATASIGQTYGADLGTASTIKTLHQRWAALRNAHPQLFEGVQPVVSVKQNARSGRTELHLIAGSIRQCRDGGAVLRFCRSVPRQLQPAIALQ